MGAFHQGPWICGRPDYLSKVRIAVTWNKSSFAGDMSWDLLPKLQKMPRSAMLQ